MYAIRSYYGYHYHAAEVRDEALPLTLYIGGPPALMLAAIAPLPENIPELVLASLLLGKKLEMVRNPHGGHPLVARTEFALRITSYNVCYTKLLRL